MKHLFLLVTLLLMPVAALAQSAVVTPLLQKDLPDLPGKEAVMLTVDYAPGASDRIHRHNAHAFIYVLEGAVQMQVRGQPEVRLQAGQSFYEAPEDVHIVGKNASNTAPAKFLVVFVKNKGTPRVVAAE